MWYVGIDLGWKSSVIALLSDHGEIIRPKRFSNRAPGAIIEYLKDHSPFKAVIEATGTYRWMYDLLSEHGPVVLAHPYRLRAIWSARAKTDKLDAQVLAKLLLAKLIPPAYVPPKGYQVLRDLTRGRARVAQARVKVINELRSLLARLNIEPPFKNTFGPRGLRWMTSLSLDAASELVRDEHVERLQHFERTMKHWNRQLEELAVHYPQTEALTCLSGVGLYTALLVIGEIGEPWRFNRAGQVAAYAGLTPRVYQSGQSTHHGRISKQGSPWLRWILVEAAYKITRHDDALRRFYDRVRKRRGKQAGRVAVARKLTEICWKRLMCWHEKQAA